MSVSESLQKDLNRLTKPEKSITPLQRVRQADAIQRARGRGVPKVNPSTEVFIEDVQREVLTVYSSLIITEDGAFEKPPNWPITGAYPSGWTLPSPLPDSLKLVGSVLSLDTSLQYYEQRRVHYLLKENLKSNVDANGVVSYTSGSIMEEQLYVPLAQPFEGNYYQGVIGYTVFYPSLSMNVSPIAANPKVGQIKQNLINNGVTEV